MSTIISGIIAATKTASGFIAAHAIPSAIVGTVVVGSAVAAPIVVPQIIAANEKPAETVIADITPTEPNNEPATEQPESQEPTVETAKEEPKTTEQTQEEAEEQWKRENPKKIVSEKCEFRSWTDPLPGAYIGVWIEAFGYPGYDDPNNPEAIEKGWTWLSAEEQENRDREINKKNGWYFGKWTITRNDGTKEIVDQPYNSRGEDCWIGLGA